MTFIISKRVHFLLVALTAATLSLAETSLDEVTLTSGEVIHGRLINLEAGFVQLEIYHQSDTAIQRLDPKTIKTLHFSDTSQLRSTQTLRKARFLGLLSETDESELVAHLETLLQSDSALEALSYAKQWHSKLIHPTPRKRSLRLLAHAALKAGLLDEATIHANTWLSQNHPPRENAFAKRILAQAASEKGNHEAALWLASYVIAHGAEDPSERARCHRIAAKSYHSLEYHEKAKTLSSEQSPSDFHSFSDPPLVLPSLANPDQSFSQLLNPTIDTQQP